LKSRRRVNSTVGRLFCRKVKAMTQMQLALILILLLPFVVDSAPQTKQRLSEAEAIEKAEQFIITQGYTDLSPTEDKRRLVPESVNPGTDAMGMKLRHDSLERKAYGVMKESGKNGAWIIIFRYNKAGNTELRRMFPDFNEHMEKWGRAVTVDVDGRHTRVQHQDFSLQFEKLKILK
jgi:hypothetical protein